MSDQSSLAVLQKQKVIANNLYRVFGDGSFETVKVRLANLSILNEFTRNDLVAKSLVNSYGLKSCLHVMCKMVPNYQDLSVLAVYDDETRNKKGFGAKILSFMEFVRKYHRPPEKVIDPRFYVFLEDNKTKEEISEVDRMMRRTDTMKKYEELSVSGLMGVLSTATSLADIDVLGAVGVNCGFLVERNSGKSDRIRIVKIDPGLAFSFELQNENYGKEDERDIRYSTQGNIIKWCCLTKSQKTEFLEVKIHHLELIQDRRILDYLFFRDGKFQLIHEKGKKISKQFEIEEFSRKTVKDLIVNVQIQEEIYREEMVEMMNSVERTRYHDAAMIEYRRGDYDRSLGLFDKHLEFQVHFWGRKGHENVVWSLKWIGDVDCERGNFSRAKKILQEALMLIIGRRNEESVAITGSIYNSLATCSMKSGNLKDAMSYLQQGLRILQKFFPPHHPQVIQSLYLLATIHRESGETDKAINNYEQTLSSLEKRNQVESGKSATTLCSLGVAHWEKKNFKQAERYLKMSLKIYQEKKVVGSDQQIANVYTSLGNVYSEMGRHVAAITHLESALELRKKSLPPGHSEIANSYNNLGSACNKKGEFATAVACFHSAMNCQNVTTLSMGSIWNNMGTAYFHQDNISESIRCFEESLTNLENSLPSAHPKIAATRQNLREAKKCVNLSKMKNYFPRGK